LQLLFRRSELKLFEIEEFLPGLKNADTLTGKEKRAQLTTAWETLPKEARDMYGARAIHEESKMAVKLQGANFRARTKRATNVPSGGKVSRKVRNALIAARATYRKPKKAPKPNEVDIVDDGS
jgi:hypothetical protein